MVGSLHTHAWPRVICRGVRGMLRPAAADQHLTNALHHALKSFLESWHGFQVGCPAHLINFDAMHLGINNDRSFALVSHISLLHAVHMMRSFPIKSYYCW